MTSDSISVILDQGFKNIDSILLEMGDALSKNTTPNSQRIHSLRKVMQYGCKKLQENSRPNQVYSFFQKNNTPKKEKT